MTTSNLFYVGERIAVALERAADALERQAVLAESAQQMVAGAMAEEQLAAQINTIPVEAMMGQAMELFRKMTGEPDSE